MIFLNLLDPSRFGISKAFLKLVKKPYGFVTPT